MTPATELLNLARDRAGFEIDILKGLRALRKKTQPKYLYDARGSGLFERICELEEYYPYRAEIEILRTHAADIAGCLGPGCLLLEFGSGASRKTRLLLDKMKQLVAYAPVDISRSALQGATRRIANEYPGIALHPVCSDFMAELRLPGDFFSGALKRAGFFPGSTIGNFEPSEARMFLERTAALLGPGGALLVGIDLMKDRAIMERAYNDQKGVTAQFNLNLLRRINQELGADFVLEAFRHHAAFNAAMGRIEMHLVSLGVQEVRIRKE
ncbi:MAG: L-histidine N(alpha)-methyltransferase, partial [Deltaproteobacteria bacterium]|nr:L-histidine N(alpha)-methyltransferase [Deltaproteobacteria bacterium]